MYSNRPPGSYADPKGLPTQLVFVRRDRIHPGCQSFLRVPAVKAGLCLESVGGAPEPGHHDAGPDDSVAVLVDDGASNDSCFLRVGAICPAATSKHTTIDAQPHAAARRPATPTMFIARPSLHPVPTRGGLWILEESAHVRELVRESRRREAG